jgi:REP element-mobilizing transposase RayT
MHTDFAGIIGKKKRYQMQKRFRDDTIRLVGFDYGSEGYYYVTICTHQMKKYLGEIPHQSKAIHESAERTYQDTSKNKLEAIKMGTYLDTSVQLSAIGLIAHQYWMEIPQHFSFVELDAFIIMPNHIHGILYFNKPDKIDWECNQFKSQANTLGSIIKQYKGSVQRYANTHQIKFKWKPRYHDRIVRSKKDLERIRAYIFENPLKI